MPSLSFSVFRDKIERGEKRQTIRRARKRPIKVGDKLYLYWHQRQKDCRPILVNGESVVICIDSYSLTWAELSALARYMAKLDGFDSPKAFREFFESHYHPKPETLFDVILW